jgi:CxxC motif-containing protein (DUF1111 family)
MSTLRFVRACMLASIASAGVVYWSGPTSAQTTTAAAVDPGVRGGPAGAGGPLPGLGPTEISFFNAARNRFQEIDSVSGTIPGEPGFGLGPRFNLNQCSGCHAQPAVGGTSPFTNPQIAVATLDGARNTIPSFITANGPIREARFVTNPDGTPDGGVHDLFVITGRTDAVGCNIVQPNFAAQLAANNVIFRIPTPLFGVGLVENTPDGDQNTAVGLVGAFNAQASLKSTLGISGHFNRSGNDGTITRFGWKAQNKSLLIFAAEAYNVEQGVTNEGFGNERDDTAGCQFNGLPEDQTNLTNNFNSGSPASDFSSDMVNFAAFMRLTAAPTPVKSATAQAGQNIFNNIGCQACHITSQTTALSGFTNQSNVTFQPFSDIAVHNMGTGLADGVSQGNANGNEFRSAPLWGLGQRIFFLHDGRTSDLVQAIRQHASSGSEANAVIANFNALGASAQQQLLAFLRSL